VLKIAVTGAPSTGKHLLASALDRALKDAGRDALVAVADPFAFLTSPAGYGLTLLCGLESAGQAQQTADQSIRSALAAAGMAYCVLYGSAPQRLAQALSAVGRLQPGLPQQEVQPDGRRKAWIWVCDKCSDPVCEHRLLSDLLAQRAASAAS
jgi:ribosomal protein L37AE/L43A